jgi:hypothetical protein
VYPISRLGRAERDEMYHLLHRHFEGVERDVFEADLSEKNWAVLLRDEAGRLAGFTTLHFYESHDGRRPCSVIYSGDTVVEDSARGSSALFRDWLEGILELRTGEDPARPLYWLLLTSGFRTYRFLPVFWRHFFPRWDRPTPANTQSVLERLAEERFGSDFHREEGIVRFPHPQRLRGRLSGIPEGRLSDPHVRFFARRNPGADRGDELVCLTRIHEDNLTPAGRRVLRSVGTVVRSPAHVVTPSGARAP